jgi:hypothetical protein
MNESPPGAIAMQSLLMQLLLLSSCVAFSSAYSILPSRPAVAVASASRGLRLWMQVRSVPLPSRKRFTRPWW